MKNYLILSIVFSLFIVSCRPKPLDIDLPQADQKLVVSSQVIPGSLMVVTVSRSMDAKGFKIV